MEGLVELWNGGNNGSKHCQIENLQFMYIHVFSSEEYKESLIKISYSCRCFTLDGSLGFKCGVIIKIIFILAESEEF